MPENMPELQLAGTSEGLGLAQVLKQAGLTPSTSEAIRMLDQGGVRLNGEKVADKGLKIRKGEAVVLQVGKRKFARVTIV